MGQVLIELVDAADEPLARVGGKARTLAELARSGFAVPEGAVVPADVADGDLDAVAAGVDERFGDVLLAVRSSADVEDGTERSHAGQFHTELRVDAEGLVAALRRVRASRAAAGEGTAMAVLVMPMVAARCAGVAFSVDPVTGARGAVVVEGVDGTAEGLVDGARSPARWRVGRGGPTRETPGSDVLSRDDVATVAEAVRAVEEHFGRPVDVEWAIDDDGLQVLQARPITALPEPFRIPDDLAPGTWVRDAHFPEPMSRFTASVLCPAISTGLTRMFREVGAGLDRCDARLIDGYYHQRMVPAGVPERALASGAAPPPAALYGLLWRLHPALRRHARAAATYLAEGRADRVLDERADGLPEALEAGLAELRAVDVRELNGDALADHVEDLVERVHHAWRAHGEYNAASATTVGRFIGAVVEALGCQPDDVVRLLAGHGDATRHATDALAAVRAAIAADPEAREAFAAGDLDALVGGPGAGAAAVRDHLDEHGGRLLANECAAPTLRGSPDVLLAALAETGVADREHPEDPLEARLRAHPEATRLRSLLERARLAYAIRDRDSLPIMDALSELRRAGLEAGRRLVPSGAARTVDDVFLLEVDEVTAWLRGGPPPRRGEIDRRRADWEHAHRTDPPPYVGPAPTAPPSPRFLPRAARDVGEALRHFLPAMMGEPQVGTTTGPDAGDVLLGAPASPGDARGIARVVRDPRDLARLGGGEILVCRITTVAWSAAFARAGAVVTEAGGVLSHPAIQAREHGVPAVVGVAGAMRAVPDGALVAVDGSRGTVRVLDGGDA